MVKEDLSKHKHLISSLNTPLALGCLVIRYKLLSMAWEAFWDQVTVSLSSFFSQHQPAPSLCNAILCSNQMELVKFHEHHAALCPLMSRGIFRPLKSNLASPPPIAHLSQVPSLGQSVWIDLSLCLYFPSGGDC